MDGEEAGQQHQQIVLEGGLERWDNHEERGQGKDEHGEEADDLQRVQRQLNAVYPAAPSQVGQVLVLERAQDCFGGCSWCRGCLCRGRWWW